jgi:hypothetical protein
VIADKDIANLSGCLAHWSEINLWAEAGAPLTPENAGFPQNSHRFPVTDNATSSFRSKVGIPVKGAQSLQR